MSENIRVKCENCGYTQTVPKLYEGKTIKCPSCKESVLAKAQNQPKSHSTKSNIPYFVCTACGSSISNPKNCTPGSFLIEIILWVAFIPILCLPGIIYTLWRLTNKKKICPICRHDTVIPSQTPLAQQILKEQQTKL